MKLLTAILTILLAGCGSIERTVEVKVMVPVPCQEPMPERPVMPTEALPPGSPVDVQARHMRAEIDRREAYETKLVTALGNCRAPLVPGD